MSRNSSARAGFTLVELSIVLFVLGLVLWIVAPRLSRVGSVDRNTAFRAFSADSEAAFDAALFEKKAWQLQIDPKASSYRFLPSDNGVEPPEPRDFGSGVTVTGITVEGEDRSLEAVTTIRYMPGGRTADTLIRLRDSSNEGKPSDWTLHLDPTNGSVDVLEGTVTGNA